VNSAPFDVFLSYSRADQTIVERVAQALHASGLRAFLDRWYLNPGRSWPEALEDALASCRAVAILLGPDGFGPWQQREQYKALDRQTKEPAFRVIPVVLPGIKDPALGFLGLNTWVDLRSDLDHGLELLAKAIRGEPAGPPRAGARSARGGLPLPRPAALPRGGRPVLLRPRSVHHHAAQADCHGEPDHRGRRLGLGQIFGRPGRSVNAPPSL
jgi:TIR domain